MYTLELAGDGETKISCPSLSPAQPEPTKSPAKDPSKGVNTCTLLHNYSPTCAPQPAFTKVPHVALRYLTRNQFRDQRIPINLSYLANLFFFLILISFTLTLQIQTLNLHVLYNQPPFQ